MSIFAAMAMAAGIIAASLVFTAGVIWWERNTSSEEAFWAGFLFVIFVLLTAAAYVGGKS